MFKMRTITILTVLLCFQMQAQKTAEKLDQLDNIGLYPLPTLDQLSDITLQEYLMETSRISTDDIAANFENIEDLMWLKPHAQENKVVLLGENHYYRFIQHIRNRMFFALNTFDQYPLIILENQYSLTGFVNHYLTLKDESEANEFLSKELNNIIHNVESMNLLKHMRRWNMRYPEKALYVGYSDVEHDYRTTLKKLIIPYFQKLGFDQKLEVDDIINSDLKEILQLYRQQLALAKKKNLEGQYPFITPSYIETVLDNLDSYYKCKIFDFNFYRQKAMVRNITEKAFLGKYWLGKKAFIHAGAYHTPNHFEYPDGGNFYREGSYLSYDFPYTKNKTYSIRIEGRAYALDQMADIDLEKCMHSGWYYQRSVKKFQKAYKKKLIAPDESYVESKMNAFDSLIMKKALLNKKEALLVDKVHWKPALNSAKQEDKKKFTLLKGILNTYQRYDKFIYVTRSPLTIARLKQQDQD